MEIKNSLKKIKLKEGFWGNLQKRNHEVSVPHLLEQSEKHGQFSNFRLVAGKSEGEHTGENSSDSNVFKIMEGMALCLAVQPDEAIESKLDELIELVGSAQEGDGYINTYRTLLEPNNRYVDLQRSHELYAMGHLIEAGVSHFLATGKRTLLNMAVRAADHIDSVFGPGKTEATSGHQEIEMALFRLYEVTLEERYRQLGKFFVDLRGDEEMVKKEYGGKPIIENDRTPGRNRPPEYRQDHALAIHQTEATGHAVRAGYLYAAMADIVREFDSDEYFKSCKAIWRNIVEKKIYLSGGVGTHQYHDEGYGDNYVLPNTGYCETCGGIALLFFAHRLSQVDNSSEYADVMEMILFNHLLSSTDLSGTLTFYRNPLSAQGPRERHPWNFPACCCTNVVRILPQIPSYLYRHSENQLYVEQYTHHDAEVELKDGEVAISMETNYPWEGKIKLVLKSDVPEGFVLNLRVPGWMNGHPMPSDIYTSTPDGKVELLLNGKQINGNEQSTGYISVGESLGKGDCLELNLNMSVKKVQAHPLIEANEGRHAFMRGPILYCFEETDENEDPEEMKVPAEIQMEPSHPIETLGEATTLVDAETGHQAVPFYAWNNRKPGKMAVWVRSS